MSNRRTSSELGATAVEYAIALVMIAAVIVAVVVVLGNQTCEQFETTSTTFAANAPVAAATNC